MRRNKTKRRNINRRRSRRTGEVVEVVVCLRPFVTVSLCSNATSSMQIENLLFRTQVSTKSSIHCHQVGCCHSGKGTHLSPPCRPNRHRLWRIPHAKTVVLLCVGRRWWPVDVKECGRKSGGKVTGPRKFKLDELVLFFYPANQPAGGEGEGGRPSAEGRPSPTTVTI